MRSLPSKLFWLTTILSTACGGSSRTPYEVVGVDQAPTLTSSTGSRYHAHEVMFRRAAGVYSDEVDAVLEELGGRTIANDSRLAQELGWVRMSVASDVTADEAISALLARGVAEVAERNYVVEAVGTVPNDPRFGELWGMEKIGAPEAWDYTTGSDSIVVAITDTGIDASHPDLAANMWTHPGEIAGNGIDDDGNGFVDDVHGWDFANDDSNPADDHGHGTHCAGTVGARGNDGVGVAGVNWRVRLMAVKFLSAGGSGYLSDGADSILYAAANGARVVNASWGCAGCYTSYIEDAIDELGAQGGTFVAAAGNSSNDNDKSPFYPAAHSNDNLIAVAATRSSDTLASFSNYGATTVDVAAPGDAILSTVPNNGYASWRGTSMAAPHVAGACGLLLSAHPSTSVAEVKTRLIATSDPLSALDGKVVANGRINVHRLIHADFEAPSAPTGVEAYPGSASDITVTWSPSPEPDIAEYWVSWGTRSGTWPNHATVTAGETEARLTGLENGVSHYIVVSAVDEVGNTSNPSEEVAAVPADNTPPPQVIDLDARTLPGRAVSAFVDSASGEASDYWAADHAVDGNPDTGWLSPGRDAPGEEMIVIGLLAPATVEMVELLPNLAYPDLFPADYDVDVSSDGANWVNVGGERGALAAPGVPHVVYFAPREIRFARLRVWRGAQHVSGLHFSGVAEIAIREVSELHDTLELRFTAPGDDPGFGAAASYDIRFARTPITVETFPAATPAASQVPAAAGALEAIPVAGLEPETTYYFAMTATDEAGNVSPMSNVATGTTVVVPPGAVVDLAVSCNASSASLHWTAPGGDGRVGTASRYDLRSALTPFGAADFNLADPVAGVPAPAPADTPESFVVAGLTTGTTYWFGLRAEDAAGNLGPVSNVVSCRPEAAVDFTPPAIISDLSAYPSLATVHAPVTVVDASSALGGWQGAASVADGNLATNWFTGVSARTDPSFVTLDLGAVLPVTRFRMHPSTFSWFNMFLPEDFEVQLSADGVSWTPAIHVEGLQGEIDSWLEWGLPTTYARYVRLFVLKHGPESADEIGRSYGWYLSLAEVEVHVLTETIDADLTWIAPGDDGWHGQAAAYDLRFSVGTMDFDAATPVATPAPGVAGTVELAMTGELPREAECHFALRTVDDAGNWSGLSNVALFATPPLPPAPVTDLAVVAREVDSLELAWTATGDDGHEGTAHAYDLRYLTEPLSPNNWDAALPVVAPPPSAPGTRDATVVTGLAPNTAYYFGIVVVDDAGNASLLSNVAGGETLDGTPPAAVSDLIASAVDPTEAPPLGLSVTDSTGEYSSSTRATHLTDGSTETLWLTAGRSSDVEESVTFAVAGGPARVGRLRLRTAAGFDDLFPSAFRLEGRVTSDDAWQVILEDEGVVAREAWEEWALGAVMVSELRLVVTHLTPWAGKLYAALAEVEVYADPADYSTIRLSWTAPGDDGDSDTAAAYDLRRDPQPLDQSSFPQATPVAGAPDPATAGTLERMEVGGLAPESTWCFALVTADEVGNKSALSNSSCATTPGMPPATVTDLMVVSSGAHHADLVWTAPGDNGDSGTAAAYDLRFAGQRITSSNWSSAHTVAGTPDPLPAGELETMRVSGLDSLTRYYFALRTRDAVGNWSAISKNAQVITEDDIPPAAIDDLEASTSLAEWGQLRLQWTAPGDNGPAGGATGYDIRVAETPILDDLDFSSATPVLAPVPQSAGASESWLVSGLQPETEYYVAIKSFDDGGNLSALSNEAGAATRDEAPAAVADLVASAGDGTIELAWTAPGDDAHIGHATRYDVRYATTPITPTSFSSAIPVAVADPWPAGHAETATVSGLDPGRTYYLALTTADERGNTSPISNVAQATTPDYEPPSRIDDLVAVTGTSAGRVTLSWTAPGDDGAEGRAAAYDLRFALSSIHEQDFASATPVSPQPIPMYAGASQTFTATGLPVETKVHLAMRARDDSGNLSPVSNNSTARTPDCAPGRVVDLRTLDVSLETATVTFTAPGDDQHTGTATRYDLRYATEWITQSTFAAATPVNMPDPAPAGATESVAVSGLQANTTYYLALRAEDERGNLSPLSNVLALATDDNEPPAVIDDLAAATGPITGSITLTWSAPGDDGDSGRAHHYELRHHHAPIDAETWEAATPVVAPAPLAAGSAHTHHVLSLDGEQTYHLALRAMDEAGNLGPLSASVAADTPAVPPGRVTDLTAVATASGIDLAWTAPGDDGHEGTATTYDLRFSTSPLDAASFSEAQQADGEPAPATAGTRESYLLAPVSESITYWIALVALDDLGAAGPISNVATVATLDLTPPDAPASVVAAVPQVGGAPVEIIGAVATSVLGPSWQSELAVDGDPATAWASAGTPAPVIESLTVELANAVSIDRVRLTPDALYPHLFARDFTVAASADGSSWATVVVEEEMAASSGAAVEWGFGERTARFVRFTALETADSFGLYYTVMAEVEVLAARANEGRMQITWMAPGDDGGIGTAARYELFTAPVRFDENSLETATAVSGAPQPLPAGTLQGMVVGELPGETTTYWAVRAVDEAGNVGSLSAVVDCDTNAVAPRAVDDLAAVSRGLSEVEISWTAPGDDGDHGVAAEYEIRYAPWSITAATFPLATEMASPPVPAAPGSVESVWIEELEPGVTYRFALVTRDEVGTQSYLSNVALARTDDAPDTTAPGGVTDLAAVARSGGPERRVAVAAAASTQMVGFEAPAVIDGSPTGVWSSQPAAVDNGSWLEIDLGAAEAIDTVRVWPGTGYADLFPVAFRVSASPDGLAWLQVCAEADYSAGEGTPYECSFDPASTRFLRIDVDAQALHDNGHYYTILGEMEAWTPAPPAGSVVVTWTATGDDGMVGAAAAFELRLGGCPYAHDSATPVAAGVPGPAGTPERVHLTGVAAGTWCLGMVSEDESDNVSAVSNVAELVVE
jgi:subtilisin family serine protease/chitodextrinase